MILFNEVLHDNGHLLDERWQSPWMVEVERKSSIVGFTILQIHIQLQIHLQPSSKYTFNHPSNTQVHLQIHLQLQCRWIQLIPANKIFKKMFSLFSGTLAGVKLTEAHSRSGANIVRACITARIWVGLSNEFNKFSRMFAMLVWVNNEH